MGVVDLRLHLPSVPTVPRRKTCGRAARSAGWGVFAPFCRPPGAAFYDTQVGFCRRTGCPRDATVDSSLCAAPPLSKGKKDLVLRYRGLAPSAGDSLARRRQKSEIGVASAPAPRRHEFPRRKRNGARSMIFSRRPSSPRFSGVVKVAARSKSTTSGTCRSLPATYNLAIAQPQPAQIPAQ